MSVKWDKDPLARWMDQPTDGRSTPQPPSELEAAHQQLARQLIERRDRILQAVHRATERFLRKHPSEGSILPLLEDLGAAAEVSRVYIFENYPDDNGALFTSQRNEWVQDGIESQISNPDLQQIPLHRAGFDRWAQLLDRGEVIHGHIDQFPEDEQALLRPQAIRSILVAPIFVGERWWGFIGFDECRRKREWSPIEIEALKTAANIIGATLQHQQVADALLASEMKYRLVVENAHEAIIIVQDDKFKFINSRGEEISGYSLQELMSRPFLELVHPEDRQMVAEHHIKRQKGEEIPQIYCLRMVSRKGDIIWLENNGVIIEWEGRPATLNFLSDITEHCQAQTALRESEAHVQVIEEKYRQLFENESDAVMVFDAETERFEEANHATLDLFGYAKDEFFNLTVHDISAEKEKTRHSVKQVKSSQTRGHKVPLRQFRRKDGSTFPGEIFASSFVSGGKKKLIGAVRDISDHLQVQEKIHALTHELIKAQENERHRIACYLHDQVAQDLSIIKIGCDTLLDDIEPSPEKIPVKLAEFSKLLKQSITAVRDLTYDLRPPGMDQLGLVRTAFQYCNDFKSRGGIEIDFFSAGMENLTLDFDYEINIFRIIQEGLNNVRQHAEASRAAVRLVASAPNIILRIEDNGKGFEVKRRMSEALKEKRMGLSNLEERVSLLGGNLSIQSTRAEGTKIKAEIPIRE